MAAASVCCSSPTGVLSPRIIFLLLQVLFTSVVLLHTSVVMSGFKLLFTPGVSSIRQGFWVAYLFPGLYSVNVLNFVKLMLKSTRYDAKCSKCRIMISCFSEQ